ncbi:cell division transport system permease protein [Desulfonispora thiosulfatigenes DSM 11270]|uniref:Cell division protein FtsX n=1 Tax=Desulfonispora thiosulfatigenes DSM 11270 TaxID=656914 RepID=A0A1W1UXV1_DESTI|nr:permease-like cell division protein FtsX [Desulfonispora thiosulfatigenes]SMB85584.1 cell division transport system permease protein [Desulfonispora thiosulfatigenes DSM 11270]
MRTYSSLKYSLRDTFRSMNRHKGMTIASISTVTISLIILGFSLLFVLNSLHMMEELEKQVEINVFLQKNMDIEYSELEKDLKNLEGVESIEFVPKADALIELQNRYGKEANIVKALGDRNPLPDMYKVQATKPEQVESIVKEIEKIEIVDKINYGKGWIEKLVSLTTWVRNAGVVTIIGILLASLFLISTTTRLTVLARRKEIRIMQFVGASSVFIKLPFYLEGMLIGIIGAVLSNIGIYYGYQKFSEYLLVSAPFLPLVTDSTLLSYIIMSILAVGVIIGTFASGIAVRKYLNV